MRRALTAVTVVAALLAAGGCGYNRREGSGAGAVDLSTAGYPVTVGKLTLSRRPERIVSLVPSATEMLFAIGAGPQVIAVDEDSNYPPAAPKTDLSGFEPGAAPIAARRPDLVVISADASAAVAGLQNLRIPVLLVARARSLDDSYRQIGQLGALTGHQPEAADLVQQMAAEIAQIVLGVTAQPRRLTYYYELDPTLYTVTSRTFVGSIFKMLGLTSVAERAGIKGGGFPQLSPLGLIRSNPDTIFLADANCCRQNASTVAARPGWGTIAAVRTGRIYLLDDDIAATWGPRAVDLARAVAIATQR
jgi:iron complex transport system substrate-binding protein